MLRACRPQLRLELVHSLERQSIGTNAFDICCNFGWEFAAAEATTAIGAQTVTVIALLAILERPVSACVHAAAGNTLSALALIGILARAALTVETEACVALLVRRALCGRIEETAECANAVDTVHLATITDFSALHDAVATEIHARAAATRAAGTLQIARTFLTGIEHAAGRSAFFVLETLLTNRKATIVVTTSIAAVAHAAITLLTRIHTTIATEVHADTALTNVVRKTLSVATASRAALILTLAALALQRPLAELAVCEETTIGTRVIVVLVTIVALLWTFAQTVAAFVATRRLRAADTHRLRRIFGAIEAHTRAEAVAAIAAFVAATDEVLISLTFNAECGIRIADTRLTSESGTELIGIRQ